MSVRTDIAAQLKLLLPTTKIVASDRSLGKLARVTLVISQREVTPAPTAGGVDVRLELVLIWPGTDIDQAEDQLDDAVIELLVLLRTKFPALDWSSASKGTYAGRWPAYLFTVKVRATVTDPEPAPEPDPDTEE